MKNVSYLSSGLRVSSHPSRLENLESRRLMSATLPADGELFASPDSPEQPVVMSLNADAPAGGFEQGIIAVLKKESSSETPKLPQDIIGVLRQGPSLTGQTTDVQQNIIAILKSNGSATDGTTFTGTLHMRKAGGDK